MTVASTSPRGVSAAISSEHLREKCFGTDVLRVGENVCGSPLFDDDAAVHEYDPVADLAGEADLVSDHDHRHAVGGEPFDDVEHLAHELGAGPRARGRGARRHQ